MKAKAARIVFMGTPDLAAYMLESLINENFHMAGVVTAPGKPAGRGRKIKQPPVKELADSNNIPVLQPSNLKDTHFLDELAALKADIQVVVAFRMLPEAVWAMPTMGTFNLHASLLPDYRGAAPINHAIKNGETLTGMTTFMIDHKIDTGNILYRCKIPIDSLETAGSLHEKMKPAGAELLIRTIEDLVENRVHPKPQDDFIQAGQILHKAPKIYKEDCLISWKQSAEQVARHIHGLSPVPGAYTPMVIGKGREAVSVKLFRCKSESEPHNLHPGTLVTDNKTHLTFATRDGFVHILELQVPGKRKMSIEEVLRGYDLSSSL